MYWTVEYFRDLTDDTADTRHAILTWEPMASYTVTWRGTFSLCSYSLTHDKSPQNAPKRIAASSAS